MEKSKKGIRVGTGPFPSLQEIVIYPPAMSRKKISEDKKTKTAPRKGLKIFPFGGKRNK